jgi:septal ring factor EnvC (AmiA/AmiB activator)
MPIIGSTACRRYFDRLDKLSATVNQLRSDRATEVDADNFQAQIRELNTQIAAIEPKLQARSKELNDRIADRNDQLTKLGTPPKFANANAHRTAGILRVSDEFVDQNLPIFISTVTEFVAFLAPYLLMG